MSLFSSIYIDPSLGENVLSLLKRGRDTAVVGYPERDDKDVLFITRLNGTFFERCPGTRKYICCGYRIFNLMMGCPFDCSYCVLQGYLPHLSTHFFVDYGRGLKEVEGFLRSSSRLLRLGTGELGDSLAVEDYVETACEFVEFFRRFDNVLFEFKTKSVNFSSLKRIDPKGRIVVSVSLTPYKLWEKEEKKTPDPLLRIDELSKLQKYGYFLGFHFDPIVLFDGWVDGYRELVERISNVVDPKTVIWISLGGLRFPRVLKPVIERRHKSSIILLGEILPLGEDGKYRYFKPLRVKAYRFLVDLLREWSSDLFIYFCMESDDVWKSVFGYSPGNMKGLSDMFEDRWLHIRTRI